jgi:transcriptional regulator with XRE-family HTH domain
MKLGNSLYHNDTKNSERTVTLSNGKQLEPLGTKIRRLRQAKGLPQDRLAIHARVDQSGLSKFERGQKGHRMGRVPLTRIAQALGTSFDALVAETDYVP